MISGTRFRLRLIFQEVDLWPGEFTIGRSHSCNITIEDLKVSREHARLLVSDNGVIIMDLGSRNGTTVDGKAVGEGISLKGGDRVRLGDYEFVFVEDRARLDHVEKPTIRTTSCAVCGHMHNVTSGECPSCGGAPAGANENRKSTPLVHAPKLASTSSIRRRSNMIDEVINMALTMEHFDKAADLVDERIAMLEQHGICADMDMDLLTDLSELNLMLAKSLKDGNRICWVIDAWARADAELPENMIVALEASSLGWYALTSDLSRYLQTLEQRTQGGASQQLLERLRGAM